MKSGAVSIAFQSICHEMMKPDAMILVYWMLRFKPTFSHSSFTFIKRCFSSSSFSAIRAVSAYLRLLIFLREILIPTCYSSNPVICMMFLAFKLNKQCNNTQPWSTPFPIWNQSIVSCPVLTVASCPAYSFLGRQVMWYDIRARHPGMGSHVSLKKHHHEQSLLRWWNSSWTIWNPKRQFSFQSQRKAMPNNVQTTTQLDSFHKLVK